ncbi:uncharacterized protein LOC143611466 [Bidens hawaiensis]|uniref:uncharacterized protein LOC143611466 n=1 Tax=Bidens hawaiensis TaxID=980011 RepID=UPI004049E9D3
MSVLLGSLHRHFIKHLVCTSFSSIHTTQNLTPNHIFNLIRPITHYPSTNSLNPTSITAAFSTSSAYETPTTGAYLSVDIQTPQHVADMFQEALLSFGAVSTSVFEPDACDINDEISVVSIFSVSEDVHQSIALAADSIGLKETPVYKVTTGYQSDWIENARESFHPIEVTQGLWIVPEWLTPPDVEATTIISLNPGLAFGTGDHPTTKLCLLLLQELIKGGETILDYGTGSGILAIAALKFGAASAVGFDIDPQAITASRHNAALNDVGPDKLELQVVPSNVSSTSTDKWQWAMKDDDSVTTEQAVKVFNEKEKYDVVVANILLNPLLDLVDHIVSYAKPGGIVGLSGIILEQVPTVVERYADLLEGITVSQIDDWACIRGTKKKLM